MNGPVVLLAVATIVGVALRRRRRRAAWQALEDRKQAALAPTIDLISVVVGAGGTITEAVGLVAAHGPATVRPAFTEVEQRRRRGSVTADALQALSEQLGSTYHPLTSVLVVSEQGGAPLTALLTRLADDADQARRRATEVRLRRLPVQLILPLVLCQLPAVIVGTVVPLAVIALRRLGA